MRSILSSIFVFAFFLNGVGVTAQTVPVKKFELTIDNIMRGPGLVGYEPTGVRWSPDGQKIYFRWKLASEPLKAEMSTYVVNADGSGLRKLSDDEVKLLPPVGGDLSDDKKTTVFADGGDIYLFTPGTGQRRQLTKTSDPEGNPRFSLDHRSIIFSRQNNLYSFSLDTNLLEQLTDIRAAGAAATTPAGPGGGFGGFGGGGGGRGQQGQDSARTGTESQESLKKEERSLLDAVRERAEKREEDDKKRKDAEKDRRKSFQLTAGQNAGNMSLSPDGKFVIVMVNETATGAKSTIVPNYVTESGYTEDIPARTKVGDVQGKNRIAILNVATGDATWVDHGQRLASSTTSAASEDASGDSARRPERPTGGQGGGRGTPAVRDRDVQLSQPIWSEDGKYAVLSARSADNKDRWIMQLDVTTGKTKVLSSIKDEAWVGGPGGFSLGWMPDNKHVYFQSERDGFSHLYKVSAQG